jgi:cytochrome P450
MTSIDIAGNRTSLPPSLNSHPFIQTIRYVKQPLPLLRECQRSFGNIFTLRMLGMGNVVMVCSPKDLKTMFTGDPDILYAGEANNSLFGAFLGSGSTFIRDGKDHKIHKQFMLPIFASERMEIYAEDIIQITNRQVSKWTIGKPFPMQTETRQIALDVILDVVFGLDRSVENKPLAVLLTKLVNIGFTSPLVMMPALQKDWGRYSPWGIILRLMRATDSAIFAEIASRKSEGIHESKDDVLSLLIKVRRNGEPLTDNEIRDELIGMLIGGHEAIGTPLA